MELEGHVPQLPPQPSDPQDLPWHWGTQTHAPDAEQVEPEPQLPHVPPQPSGPHCRPSQRGTHAQRPSVQLSPELQVPQLPPHPLSPHSSPAQLGVQEDGGVPPSRDGLPASSRPLLPASPAAGLPASGTGVPPSRGADGRGRSSGSASVGPHALRARAVSRMESGSRTRWAGIGAVLPRGPGECAGPRRRAGHEHEACRAHDPRRPCWMTTP